MRFLKAVEKAPTHKTVGCLFTQVGAVRRRACGGVFSNRIWRGASQAQDVPRCSSPALSGCVWSCCFVVCLAEVCCRGRSASAGRIVEAHRTHFHWRPLSFPGQPGQNLDELVEPASEDLVSTIVVLQLREASKTKTYQSRWLLTWTSSTEQPLELRTNRLSSFIAVLGSA